MNPAWFSPIADHLWQSTAFAAVAALLTLTLRRKRARVRHGLWLAASCKFLVPFSLLIVLGGRIGWHAPQAAPVGSVAAMEAGSEPFRAPVAVARPAQTPHRTNPIPAALLAIWACGVAGISLNWWRRWRRVAATVRAGTPVDLHLSIRAVSSPTLVEPGVFGIFGPTLVLPAGIFDRLTPTQLEAVVAHELCHVRYRDNLVATLHMLVETIFWFHPLVWWIGKRMVDERERACDEGVLSAGSEPRMYAEAILNICKLYTESPLVCISGLTGANLKRRIEGIMKKRIVGDLHIAQKIGLAVAGAATLMAPILVGAMQTATAQAQMAAAPIAEPAPEGRSTMTLEVVAPPAVAPAPQAVAAPAPQPDDQATRAEYAREHFTNRAMINTYAAFGPPDQIEDRAVETAQPVQIWRYRYLESFHDRAEFEFSTKSRFGMRMNYPEPQTFEGTQFIDLSAASKLASALARETRPGSDTTAPVTPGFPGRHASMQTALKASPTTWFVNLTVPLDTLSGRVDVIGQVKTVPEPGGDRILAANFRDYVDAQTGVVQSMFTLSPGSYLCQVLVREQSTGLMYTESIPFELK